MKDHILVSAVITTCQRELKYLRRAVESVLNQDYKNIELIIIDDSPSGDSVRENVAEYCNSLQDKNVVYSQNQKQLGACASRNRGLHLSKGTYIAFLDDDDEWLPNKISMQLDQLEATPRAGLVYSDFWLIAESTGEKRRYSKTSHPYQGNVYDEIIRGNFIGSTSVPLIKKDVLLQIGGFDVEQPAMQDWDVWIRIAEHYEIAYVPECLINYYEHEGTHITKSPDKRLKGLMRLNEKQRSYLELHKDIMGSRYYYMMRLYIAKNDVKNALKYYGKSISCQPKNVMSNVLKLKSFLRLFIKPRRGWS